LPCAQRGPRPIDDVDDAVVAEWLAGGKRNGTVPALRAMFNDAASAKAGRTVRSNPFARLGISRGPGRRHEQPPSEEQVWKIIRSARELATPSFAAWLQVAAFTGLRPGELDALRRVNVDLDRSRIRVVEQFSAATRTFTLPKNGQIRDAPLTEPAREALVSLPRRSRSARSDQASPPLARKLLADLLVDQPANTRRGWQREADSVQAIA
jgi:integrase